MFFAVLGRVRRGKTPSVHLDPIEVVMHRITLSSMRCWDE